MPEGGMIPGNVLIAGIVTDKNTGAVIDRAHWTVTGAEGYSESDGWYNAYFSSSGTFYFTFSKSGYDDKNITVEGNVDQKRIINVQMVPEAAPPPPPEKADLHGKITDSVTGNPIAGVSVTFGALSDTTDSSGNYRITVDHENKEDFFARKDGYTEVHGYFNISLPNDTKYDFSMSLVAPPEVPSILTGTVIDTDTNEPIPDVTVAWHGMVTHTNTSGVYEFPVTERISVPLSVAKDGYEPRSMTVVIDPEIEINRLGMWMRKVEIPSPPPPPETALLFGVIREKDTNLLLSGVTVSFAGVSDTTPAEGNYELIIPPDTDGILEVSKEGYDTFTQPSHSPPAGQEAQMNIFLYPSVVVPPLEPQWYDAIWDAIRAYFASIPETFLSTSLGIFGDVWKSSIGETLSDPLIQQLGLNPPALEFLSIILTGKDTAGVERTPTIEELAQLVAVLAAIGAGFALVDKIAALWIARFGTAAASGTIVSYGFPYAADASLFTTGTGSILSRVLGSGTAWNVIKWGIAGLIGVSGLMTWLASDNVVTGSGFFAATLPEKVREGTLTKEEGLAELQRVYDWVDYAETFLRTTTILNPLLWLFRPIILSNVDLAKTRMDAIKAEIEALLDVGTLTIIPTPADAHVAVAGQIPTTGTFTAELPIGIYSSVVSKFGYTSESQELEVKKGELTAWNPTLAEIPVITQGTLVLSLSPENATVEIAGHPEITVAGEFILEEGSYTIKASKEGYYDKSVTSIIKAEETTTTSITLTEKPVEPPTPPPPVPGKGTLIIESEPAGAKIYIDGEYKFVVTPYTILLDPKDYTIRLELDDYETIEESITVIADETVTYTKTMTAIIPPEVPPEVPEVPVVTYTPTYPAPTVTYPTYIPQVTAVIPAVPGTQLTELSALMGLVPAVPPKKPPVKPPKKSIVLNIETTGYEPWEDKLIAVGLQDPLKPKDQPTVIMHDDEIVMLKALLKIIKDNGYNELIGYGIGFDFRFIIVKCMYHRIDCKEFFDCNLYDTMERMAKGKAEYVYMPQRPPKLSELSDYLFGYPKPFTDVEMLKYYAQGRLDKVLEFASGQISRILLLYYLFRKVSETESHSSASGIEGSKSLSSDLTTLPTSSKLTIPEANEPETWLAKCPEDLSEWDVPISQNEFVCPIDGTIIKRTQVPPI